MSVRTGLDSLLERCPERLCGGRVGLLSNTGAVDQALMPTHEALMRSGAVRLARLFAHEHGLYGDLPAGAAVGDSVDPRTALPVVSLYGADRAVEPDALSGLDAVLVDMQERGARYYTVLGTTLRLLGLCAEASVPLVVLDRPNPLGAMVEGNVEILPAYRSLVGSASVPMRHGLTLGELVRLAAAERGHEALVSVVRVEGWRRTMRWPALGRPWVGGSPNSNCLEMARIYPATCLIEGTNLSEGRGTAYPFQQIGAPWLDGWALAERLRPDLPEGVWARPVVFRPTASKHAGERCEGVMLHLDPDADAPVLPAGLALLRAVLEHPRTRFIEATREDRMGPFERLAGGPELREDLERRRPVAEILASWEDRLQAWPEVAAPFRLYG